MSGAGTATYIYLAGDSAQFAAAMDEAATTAEEAADRIDESLSATGGSAAAIADNISASFSGTAADIATSMTGAADDAGSAVEGAAARIDEALSSAGAGADATAASIAASLDASAEGISAAFGGAAAKVDASLDSISASAAATATDVTSSSAETAAAMSASAAAGGDEMVESLGAAGVAAGVAARDGVASESAGIADDLGQAGEDAGTALTEGMTTSSADMAEQLGSAGVLAGSNLRSGVSEGAEGVEDDAADIGESSGGAFSSKFGLGLGVAAAAVVAFGVDLATKMQTADTAIATSEGISTSAAKAIGTAFLQMSNEFGGKEMATAFAKVAGQLKSMTGQALTTAQSTAFMSQAAQLATAKQITLGSATSTLAAVMQAYQVNLGGAAHASTYLFESANATSQSVTAVGTAVDKLKTRLGALSPSLKTISALLVDEANHGETGRAAMSSLNTTFAAFLKPASAVATAQRDLTVATKALTPTLAAYAKSVEDGKMKLTQLTTITTKMTERQAALWGEFTSSYTASIKAATGYKRMGITALTATGQLRPLKTIVGQLHTQIRGMSAAQAIATLTADGFGSSAAKMVKVIQGGTTAFDKATTSVAKYTAVQKAATVENHTFDVVLKTIKADLEDWLTLIGQVAMPVLGDLFGIIGRGVDVVQDLFHWFQEGEPVVTGLAGAIGGMLLPVLATSIINAGLSGAAQVASWATTAVASVKGAGTTQSSWIKVSHAAATSAASTEESGGIISRTVSRLGNALFPELAEKVSSATESVNSSVESMGTGTQATAARIAEATGSIDNDLRGLTTPSGAAAEAFNGDMTEMGAASTRTAVEVGGSLGSVDTALSTTTSEAAATEGAMSISMGGMLGPIGLVAGAVGGLSGVFLGLLHHSTAAAQALANQIKNVNQSLSQMTTSTVAGLDGYMLKLTQRTEKYEQQLRNLTPGSKSFTELINETSTLTEKLIEATRGADNLQTNVTVLSHAFGISKTQAEAVARAIHMTLHAALTTRQVQLFGSRLTSTMSIPLAKVAAASKVTTATLIATAKRRVATLEAATATYSQYAKTSLAERVALTQKTGAAATAALINATKGGLPIFEAIMSEFGVSIPKNTLGELTQALTKTGYVSITKLAHSIQRGGQLVVNAARGEIVTPITDSLTDVKKRMATTGKKAVTVYVGVFTDAKGQFIAAGQTLPAGLTEGILSGTASVSAAVAKLVTDALAAGRKASQSTSPSKLFAEQLGKPISQGTTTGILEGGGSVGAAIHTVVKAALTPAQSGFAEAAAFGKSIAEAAATSFVKAFTVTASNAGFAAAQIWEKTLATKAKMAGLAAATSFVAAFTSKANASGFAKALGFEKTLASKASAAAAAVAARARTGATVGVNASVFTARAQLTADKGVLGSSTIAAYQKMLTSAVKGGTKTKIGAATTAITNAVETMLGNLSTQYAKSFSTGLKRTLYKSIEALSSEKATLGSTYLGFASQLAAALKSGSAGNVTSALAAINKAATAKLHPVTTATTSAAVAATVATYATGTTTNKTAAQFATAMTKATAGVVAFTGALVQATTAVQNFTVHVNVAANMNLSTPGEAEKVGALVATGVRNQLVTTKRSLGGAIRPSTGLGLA